MNFIGNTKLWGIDYFYVKDDQYLTLYRVTPERQSIQIITGGGIGEICKEMIVGNDRSKKTMVFYVEDFPKNESDYKKDEYRFVVTKYMVLNWGRPELTKISFIGPEINCIYPPIAAIDKFERNEQDQFLFQLKQFSEMNTKKSYFEVDGKRVEVYFGKEINISNKTDRQPVTINSALYFRFDGTTDYKFIGKLCHIGKEFIQYLCYRKNVQFNNIFVYGTKRQKIGKFKFENSNYVIEKKPLEKGRCIQLKSIEGYEGNILKEIADETLYTVHLPDSYQDSLIFNEARFLLITGAFEWTYQRVYPDSKISSSRKKANEAVLQKLKPLEADARGKEKGWYKKFIKEIENNCLKSLQDKIAQTGKKYKNVLLRYCEGMAPYAKAQPFDFVNIGKEIATQRNNYAHGNIDKEYREDALPGIVILEYTIYCMQLALCEIPEDKIILAIDQLFSPMVISNYEFRDLGKREENGND